MAFDMNAGRRKREQADSTENQIELREQLKRRNQTLDASSSTEQQGGEELSPSSVSDGSDVGTPIPTGLAAERPCFLTIAIPESIKRIVDMKVRYDSKELPTFNQTIKHIGRRWFLRGLLSEGLITQEQFDEATALHSEYGWERDKVSEKRRKK